MEAPGRLGKGGSIFRLSAGADGADGMTVDSKGNIYVCTVHGIQVVSPGGKLLGILKIRPGATNATFGGPDLRFLYVAAKRSIYRVRMEVKGHRFPAGPER